MKNIQTIHNQMLSLLHSPRPYCQFDIYFQTSLRKIHFEGSVKKETAVQLCWYSNKIYIYTQFYEPHILQYLTGAQIQSMTYYICGNGIYNLMYSCIKE